MGSTRQTVPIPPFEKPELGRLLGDLARGDVRWEVRLECRDAEPPFRGRLHFVGEHEVRSTGWIFLERAEEAILARFAEFSAAELWQLVDSLA